MLVSSVYSFIHPSVYSLISPGWHLKESDLDSMLTYEVLWVAPAEIISAERDDFDQISGQK